MTPERNHGMTGSIGYWDAWLYPKQNKTKIWHINGSIPVCVIQYMPNNMPCKSGQIYTAKYLLISQDEGIYYEPDPSKGLEYYVDADFMED